MIKEPVLNDVSAKKMKASQYNIAIIDCDESTVLYNTRTGMLIRVSNHAYTQLKQISVMPEPLHNPYISSFMRRGFCVPANMDESAQFYGQYLKFA